MNNLKRTMSLFIILAMMLTALSFSTAVSAAAESATLDYDDFVYYKHTDGLWYILGFNPDSDITSTAAYSISVPDVVNLTEKTFENDKVYIAAGLGTRGAEETVSEDGATVTNAVIKGIAAGAFYYKKNLLTSFSTDKVDNITSISYVGAAEYTDEYTGLKLVKNSTLEKMGGVKVGGTGGANEKAPILSKVTMSELIIPDSVTCIGKLTNAGAKVSAITLGKGITSLTIENTFFNSGCVTLNSFLKSMTVKGFTQMQFLRHMNFYTDGTADYYKQGNWTNNYPNFPWQDMFANKVRAGSGYRLGQAREDGLDFTFDNQKICDAMIATKYVYGKYSNNNKVGNLTDEQIDALDEADRHLNTNNLVDAEGNTYKYGTGYIFTEDNISVRPYIAYGDDMQDAASNKYRFKYEISKGKAALLGFDTSEGYTVPENIDMVIDKAGEYPVTSVAAGAFADNTTAVRTLDVKASVTSIEANAFSNSTSLVYANIPSETTVDNTAFSNITSPIVAGAAGKDSKNNDYILGFSVNPLTHTAKLNGFYLTTIGGTTYGAPYLANLAIPSNIPLDSEHSDMIFEVNEIAANAFKSGRYSNGNETKTADNWLLKCRVPSTVTSIGTNAFDSQIYMASVLIENGDKPLTLGSALFKTCQRLGTVVLPSRISALNYGEMFANTHRLQNIVINGNISEGIASNIADMIKTASGSRDTTYDTKVHVIVNDNTYNLLKAKLKPEADGSFNTITDGSNPAKTMYLENIGGGAAAYLGRTNADNKNRDYINVAAPDNFNNAKLILAKYSSGSEPQQLAVKVIDVSEALKNDGLYQLCISATYNDGTFYKTDGTPLTDVTYKVFLWENDFSSCKPVCKLTEWTSAGVVK